MHAHRQHRSYHRSLPAHTPTRRTSSWKSAALPTGSYRSSMHMRKNSASAVVVPGAVVEAAAAAAAVSTASSPPPRRKANCGLSRSLSLTMSSNDGPYCLIRAATVWMRRVCSAPRDAVICDRGEGQRVRWRWFFSRRGRSVEDDEGDVVGDSERRRPRDGRWSFVRGRSRSRWSFSLRDECGITARRAR